MAITARERRKLLRRRREAMSRHYEMSEVDRPEDYYDNYDAAYEMEDEDYDPDRPSVHAEYNEDEWVPYRISDGYREEDSGEDEFHPLYPDGEHHSSGRNSRHRSRSSYRNNSPGGHSSRMTGSSMRRRKSQF